MEVTDGIAKAHVGGNVTLKCRSKAFPPTENYWTSGNHEPISSGGLDEDKHILESDCCRRSYQSRDLGG